MPCWCATFIEGRKQAEIAEEMNLSTSKVNRIIAQARRSGMVKISIETPFQRLMELERQLAATGLGESGHRLAHRLGQ